MTALQAGWFIGVDRACSHFYFNNCIATACGTTFRAVDSAHVLEPRIHLRCKLCVRQVEIKRAAREPSAHVRKKNSRLWPKEPKRKRSPGAAALDLALDEALDAALLARKRGSISTEHLHAVWRELRSSASKKHRKRRRSP